MTKTKSDNQIKLTLVRSLIGRSIKHKQTIKCLGLRTLNQVVLVPNNPSTQGMINKVSYLLKVEGQ